MARSVRKLVSARSLLLPLSAWIGAMVLIAPAQAEAASASEMRQLIRLLRENGPAGATIVVEVNDDDSTPSLIMASHAEGPDGRPVVTLGLKSRIGIHELGDAQVEKGPGHCNIVLQDTDGDGTPEFADFECDRASTDLAEALGPAGQPLFDGAVRALIRQLTTV
jgi:hypothetical protein